MNKKTKLGVIIAAIAAVVSAAILIVVFWDKLLDLCSRKQNEGWEADLEPQQPELAYNEEERQDFADLNNAE